MRKMTDGKNTINVLQWFITKGIYWEYYVTEKWNEDNLAYCLVDGDFQEIGLVSLDEMKPHISVLTTDLTSIAPAIGWEWTEE